MTTVVVAVGDEPPFDPYVLLGEWSGAGMLVMPMTGVELEVEGSASFVQDSSGGYIRTGISGTKFLYTYSDSGHFYVNPDNDSLIWEVWDGFGRHGIYEGIGRGDTLTGRRRGGNAVFQVTTTMVTPDSLDLHLYYLDNNGRRYQKARLNLGRNR
ncbi:MAG: hypothetical protein OEV49_00015 [candidate division Zixibacteria bacterium]|nr:hypothetical protein [candidate division Zixibacteria bacterium]MDH3939125.1 hypothetical protein [candidate division Zixibacteria bacterium]MDH4033324.1 hypothetical protein [candidate division Zixibacteria bacterium]